MDVSQFGCDGWPVDQVVYAVQLSECHMVYE
jgi:hypothetical protein